MELKVNSPVDLEYSSKESQVQVGSWLLKQKNRTVKSTTIPIINNKLNKTKKLMKFVIPTIGLLLVMSQPDHK